MSAEEDTELRDLVAQTLEANGTLGKLRAQLRASVFLALEEQESVQNRTPFLNKELKNFLSSKDGQLVTKMVREFLEFFHLEFTLAVFDPEAGMEEAENRETLAKELNLKNWSNEGQGQGPLLLEVLKAARANSQQGPATSPKTTVAYEETDVNNSHQYPKNLTEKQVAEAKRKFEQYDKDGSGAIDKDELRELFMDMFPSFNKNMLERYVNDEFRAVDRDFSSRMYFTLTPRGIDFDEFLSMYKRLFLQCRTVVSGEVEDIIHHTHKKRDLPSTALASKGASTGSSVDIKNQRNVEKSAPPLPLSAPPTNLLGGRNNIDDLLGLDMGDDPFFDDNFTSDKLFHNRTGSGVRSSQIPVFAGLRSDGEKSKTKSDAIVGVSGKDGTSHSSLGDLPFLNSGSLISAPSNNSSGSKTKTTDQSLRTLDSRMADIFTGDNMDDLEYEDDFQSSGHSLSQRSQRSKGEGKTENGSIAEEIDDEEIDFSVEADDLLKSENSGYDELTTDRSISQVDGGFDYVEDPQQ